MIFVTVGTTQYPFYRMINSIVAEYSDKPSKKIIIQNGSTKINKTTPNHIILKNYLSLQKMTLFFKTADIVVSACGEGSVLQMMGKTQKKPIFFPRDPRYGEHMDDQQLLIAKEIKQQNIGIVANSTNHLIEILNKQLVTNSKHEMINRENKQKQILNYLSNYTNKQVGK